MRGRTLARFAVAAGAALIATFAAAGPATANVTGVKINDGNVPTTAAGFSTHGCSADLGGGPFPGQDVWVFNLPDQDRDFVQIVADFDTNGDLIAEQHITIEDGGGDGDAIVRIGTSKAWVVTPAGWTLLDATAEVTGSAPTTEKPLEFVLTHTCPSSGTPSSSSSSSGSKTPSESGSSGGGGSSSSSAGGGGGSLPTTGAKIGVLVGIGLVLVAGGVGLVALRRRRDIVVTPDGS